LRISRILLIATVVLLVVVALHWSIRPVCACDPNDPTTWPDAVTTTESETLTIRFTTQPTTDQPTYAPGDTVTISGAVGVTYKSVELVTSASCGYSTHVTHSSDYDPSQAYISIADVLSATFAVSSAGSFSASIQASSTSGTYQHKVDAIQPNEGSETGSTATALTNTYQVADALKLTLTVTCQSTCAQGEYITISGMVTSVSDGQGVSDAAAVVAGGFWAGGSTNTYTTDASGQFSFKQFIPDQATPAYYYYVASAGKEGYRVSNSATAGFTVIEKPKPAVDPAVALTSSTCAAIGVTWYYFIIRPIDELRDEKQKDRDKAMLNWLASFGKKKND
jgi:hypothetical protein